MAGSDLFTQREIAISLIEETAAISGTMSVIAWLQ
jgi:hypothetical protein